MSSATWFTYHKSSHVAKIIGGSKRIILTYDPKIARFVAKGQDNFSDKQPGGPAPTQSTFITHVICRDGVNESCRL